MSGQFINSFAKDATSIDDLPAGVDLVTASWLAKLAAWKLKSPSIALVLGNKIHLWGVTSTLFLEQKSWVRHELVHVNQYQRLGFIKFLWLYSMYSIRYGYYKNPLEIEARAAE